MIPLKVILALVFTSLFLFYYLIDIHNKYINIGINLLLSSLTSFMWCYIIIGNFYMPKIISIILLVLFTILFTFILMVFTYKNVEQDTSNKNLVPVTYTEDTLIGSTGVVSSLYNEDSYLCYLLDRSRTPIVIHFENEDIHENDEFTITKIDGGVIFGSKK